MRSDQQILSRLVRNMKRRGADPLTPLIDEYLLKRDRSPNRLTEHLVPLIDRPRPGGRLSPSSICGCERQAALRLLGVRGRRRIDPDTQLIFDDGNWRHHRWDATFLDMQRVLGTERFEVLTIEESVAVPSLRIAGALDVYVLINREPWVIDFKGINEYGFSKVIAEDAPIHEHVRQLTAYMKAKRCSRGMILYDNKNTQHYRIYTVRFDRQVWEEVRGWCRRVLRFIEREELPNMHPECAAGNFLYQRCQYAHLCYGTKDREQIAAAAYKGWEGLEAAWERGMEESGG